VKPFPKEAPRTKRFWISIDVDTEKRFKKLCKHFDWYFCDVAGRLISLWTESMEKKLKEEAKKSG